MRLKSMVAVLGVGMMASSILMVGQAKKAPARLNPMITLHEQNLGVFGVTHPAITAGRGGGGRGGPGGGAARGANPAPAAAPSAPAEAQAPPAQPSLMEAARETMAYKLSDFEYNSYSSANADRFLGYVAAMIAMGGTMSSHPYIAKVPIVHTDPAAATARIIEQLNAGHAGVMMQQVETADEVRQALAAMRFKSKGGGRPEEGFGLAAAYWGISKAEYLAKADPWPLNPNGELVLWTIVESKKGIENIREIAAVKGLTVIVVGAGTLGGVFSSVGADGQRVRDTAGFDAAVLKVAAACKEFKVQCSHPANNPAEIERLMGMGFNVFTMQSRNQAGFDALLAGRKISGRPVTQ